MSGALWILAVLCSVQAVDLTGQWHSDKNTVEVEVAGTEFTIPSKKENCLPVALRLSNFYM